MKRPEIGAKSPFETPIWRNPAYSRLAGTLGFASSESSCDGQYIAAVPQVYPAVKYHFRTPSPGGQQSFSNVLLPAFFSWLRASAAARRTDIGPSQYAHRREGAHRARPCREQLIFKRVCLGKKKTSKGINPWRSNHSSSRLLQFLDLPRAATPLASRLLSAVASALSVPQRLAATPLRVRPLALVPTFCTATGIPADADPLTRAGRVSIYTTQRRQACQLGGVFRAKHKSSEAPCSRSF